MATELNWVTVPNVQAPTFSAIGGFTAIENCSKYHGWFLVETLIGANPLNSSANLAGNTGLWHLRYITSGSSYQEYTDGDTSYRSSNLWMASDKTFDVAKVPYTSIYAVDTINSPNTAWYNPPTSSLGGRRGTAVLKSPLINGRNYYMVIDLGGNNTYYITTQECRVFLYSAEPTIPADKTNRRADGSEDFSYFVNDQSPSHIFLGMSSDPARAHKHSISLASDGSFYYYNTHNTADTFMSMFAFTGLKNTATGDSRAVVEIRVRDGEINSNQFSGVSEGPGNRGFIPNSFINMSAASTNTKLPYSYNWWYDKNVISRATTFFKCPRHDGTSGGATVTSASIGVSNHIVNVWDYTDAFSPLYGQSNINGLYGEMPVIIGSEQVPANNGYCALRGRIPDFKYAPNNIAQGSVRPSSAPFEYVKIGGFWCPWVSSVAPTM